MDWFQTALKCESLLSFAGKYYEQNWRQTVEDMKPERRFDAWFGDRDRIWMPFTAPRVLWLPRQDMKVLDTLSEYGYRVFEIEDYLLGYCSDKYERKVSIGRALNKEMEKQRAQLKSAPDEQAQGWIEDRIDELAEALNIFQSSPARQNAPRGRELAIVISRNPHDIAQMSTDRGWTSCMNLAGGEYSSYAAQEALCGGLIAYLVETRDKNIESPLARVLLRRIEDNMGNSYVVPEQRVYGVDMPGFLKAVQDWVESVQPDIPVGVYTRQGGEYSDSVREKHEVLPSTPEEILAAFYGTSPLSEKWTVSDPEGTLVEKPKSFGSMEEVRAFMRTLPSGENPHERLKIERENPLPGMNLKEYAIKSIMQNPKLYHPSVLKEVHDHIFSSPESVRTLRADAAAFIRNYPELCTPDDVRAIWRLEDGAVVATCLQGIPDSSEKRALAIEMGESELEAFRQALQSLEEGQDKPAQVDAALSETTALLAYIFPETPPDMIQDSVLAIFDSIFSDRQVRELLPEKISDNDIQRIRANAAELGMKYVRHYMLTSPSALNMIRNALAQLVNANASRTLPHLLNAYCLKASPALIPELDEMLRTQKRRFEEALATKPRNAIALEHGIEVLKQAMFQLKVNRDRAT